MIFRGGGEIFKSPNPPLSLLAQVIQKLENRMYVVVEIPCAAFITTRDSRRRDGRLRFIAAHLSTKLRTSI